MNSVKSETHPEAARLPRGCARSSLPVPPLGGDGAGEARVVERGGHDDEVCHRGVAPEGRLRPSGRGGPLPADAPGGRTRTGLVGLRVSGEEPGVELGGELDRRSVRAH